jgi:hypothetical protein
MDDGLNGRRLHHWRGRPGHAGKENDTSEFADAIVAAVPELYTRDGVLVQLVEGQLIGVNFASLKSLITKHLCGIRVVQRDGRWEREYFSYEFPSPPLDDEARRDPDAIEAVYKKLTAVDEAGAARRDLCG